MTLHGTSCFDYPWGRLLGKKLENCTFANAFLILVCRRHTARLRRGTGINCLSHAAVLSSWPVNLAKENYMSQVKLNPKKKDAPIRLISVGRLHIEKEAIPL